MKEIQELQKALDDSVKKQDGRIKDLTELVGKISHQFEENDSPEKLQNDRIRDLTDQLNALRKQVDKHESHELKIADFENNKRWTNWVLSVAGACIVILLGYRVYTDFFYYPGVVSQQVESKAQDYVKKAVDDKAAGLIKDSVSAKVDSVSPELIRAIISKAIENRSKDFDDAVDSVNKEIKTIRTLRATEEAKSVDKRVRNLEQRLSPFGNNISGIYYQQDTNPKAEQIGTDIYIFHVGRLVLLARTRNEATTPNFEVGMQIAENEFAFVRDKNSFADFKMESMIRTEKDGTTTLYYAPRMNNTGPYHAIFLPRPAGYIPNRIWPVDGWHAPESK